MATVEKKERKLKKSEEKQIQKIVSLLEKNPDAILWVELFLLKVIESSISAEDFEKAFPKDGKNKLRFVFPGPTKEK
ncbi:hypothetical protein [Leptospira licerasiae]|uniref:hypothetical protein n=1 Tax=Leptospira licerasiae TaxID=447106 RepID=UPI00301A3DF2